MANPISVTYQLAAAVSNGIAQSQTPGGAGNLTLNGSLVSGGVATLDSGGASRRVAITSAGSDESNKNFTIYGTDRNGLSQHETIAGPTASATVYSNYDYKTVTRIAVSAATSGAITAGTNGVGSTQWFSRDWVNISILGVLLYIPTTSTATASVEGTIDDPNQPLDAPPYYATFVAQSDEPPITAPFDGWANLSATRFAEITCPCNFFRLTITSGTDAVTLKVIESTPWSRVSA